MTSTKIKWGQSVAWLIFGILFPLWHRGAFSNCAFPFSPRPPTHTRVGGKQMMIYEFQRVRIGGLWRMMPVLLPGISSALTIYPVSAPLLNLKASVERTKNQLSNACLRSRNGGVGAEICLRKVKWDCLAGRGLSFSRGRPYACILDTSFWYCNPVLLTITKL